MTAKLSPTQAIDKATELYNAAVGRLRAALEAFVTRGETPDPQARLRGDFCYPELRLAYDPHGPVPPLSRAFAKLSEAGLYVSTITQPAFFRGYFLEQLEQICADFDVHLDVVSSKSEIPYPYVLEHASSIDAEALPPAEFARWFPTPRLELIGDEVIDAEIQDGGFFNTDGVRPLALFDGPRIDFSLQRLKHYTGTPFEHVQRYILFTNYHRYVDHFVEWSIERLKQPGPYTKLSAPGGIVIDAKTKDGAAKVNDGPWRKHQMPAYHLMTDDSRSGITLVNIGVGPSNAKTITDHLAVLRPECWIMVGHCGGLRHSQRIGDYVLAHAYLRDDHVLDAVLPRDIPVPPIAEVQVALQEAAEKVTGEEGDSLKQRLRTGTVVTTDDRNWELRFTDSAKRFNKSRAIAIDMESATIAANGYRMRVPYGVLLCVSDKPLHGEIKLAGAANRFYERAIGEHIRIGIETLESLARAGGDALHSRKLRSFYEPPFR
ncbi:MAG: AMP nucleosidase [Rhodobacterales bacterium 12-64-8]|nr:MAG: AMP nucleosidase [Rhodobacterales bacterium 12-64-8]OYX50477.1 MAG: AMP nucleosidase [Alphaproteobacteria bacterium 32-64-14]